MSNLHGRVDRLERARGDADEAWGWRTVFVDDDGLILDDGDPAIQPWVGRHHGELPAVGKIIQGVDPRILLGLDLLEQRGTT